MWFGLALRVEAQADHHIVPDSRTDTLERALANLPRPHALDPLADPRAVIRAADEHGYGRDSLNVEGPERWQQALQDATTIAHLTPHASRRHIEADHDLGLGL